MPSKIIFTLASLIVTALPLFSQDLGQLKDRVSRLWELRSQQKRLDALQLIDPETRDLYLQLNEAPLPNFKIAGMEFTDDNNHVDVLVKVHTLITNLGEIDKTVKEAWVWKNGQWLMHAEPYKSMTGLFDSDPEKRPTGPVIPEFRIPETLIDVGQHTQGDVVEGKIAIHSSRNDIRTIRPLQKIAGLTIGSPIWTNASEGYLPYRWETMLVSQNVDQKVQLEAIGVNDARATIEVEFRARIEGRISFKQFPELVEMGKSGQVELQLGNLSKKPLKILSVMSYNPAYVVDDNVPPVIEPGKSGRLLIRYAAQPVPTGASIGLVFGEEIGGVAITTVPLNVQLPEPKPPATYTQDDLKKLVPQQPLKLP